jgi:hypothetical protein
MGIVASTHDFIGLCIIKLLFPCGEEYNKRNFIRWKVDNEKPYYCN